MLPVNLMTGEISQTGIAKDELDLSMVLDRFIRFLERSWLIICSWTIAGLILGTAYYFLVPKQYKSNSLLHSFTFTNTEHIKIIENWNELIRKGEHQSLAGIFTANVEDIKKLHSLKAAEIQKLYIPNNPNGFMVEAWVKDYKILDSLQVWILRGLEYEPFIKEKMYSKRKNLESLILTTKAEILKLDSAKSRIEENISKRLQGNNSFIFDISGINAQKISLQEKLLCFQDELKFTAPVQILHPFEKFTKPASPKLLKSLVLGLMLGFAIGYLIAVFSYLRSKVSS